MIRYNLTITDPMVDEHAVATMALGTIISRCKCSTSYMYFGKIRSIQEKTQSLD